MVVDGRVCVYVYVCVWRWCVGGVVAVNDECDDIDGGVVAVNVMNVMISMMGWWR